MVKLVSIWWILAAFALGGCTNNTGGTPPVTASTAQTGEHKKITAEEAKRMMDGSKTFILLDVRTEEEFMEKRIDGALLIPDYEIKERAEAELPDKGAHIMIYCRSGRRSAQAAKELADMGYTNIYDFGGIIDWPFETVGE